MLLQIIIFKHLSSEGKLWLFALFSNYIYIQIQLLFTKISFMRTMLSHL